MTLVVILVAVAAPLAALVGSALTWRIALRQTRDTARTHSGAIDTSEAAVLWDEGTHMRLELREEVAGLKIQLAAAITAIQALNAEITRSRQETEAAREESRKSREETRVLMGQIEALHADTTSVLHEVKTSNTLTLGQLGDNDETRRILLVPAEERTIKETEHLDTASDRIPENLRADQGGDRR